MSTPITETVLAIDFSLDRLDVSLRDSADERGWPHQAYPNNWPGFQALKTEVLAHLADQANSHLTVCFLKEKPSFCLQFNVALDQKAAVLRLKNSVSAPENAAKRFKKQALTLFVGTGLMGVGWRLRGKSSPPVFNRLKPKIRV